MKPRILYIASSGIRHPLVVSQVVRYLKRLSQSSEICHLVTLERDPFEPGEEDRIRQELLPHQIHWHGQQSYPNLRAFNIWREIYGGYRKCLKLIKDYDLNIIHARSFIPGNIALRLSRKTGLKFLYDMRGFWTHEKWAKGTIKNQVVRNYSQKMENRLFSDADSLVSLSFAGKNFLKENGIKTQIDVIPCCCDTELFFPAEVRQKSNAHQLIAAGSLGPGYLPEAVFGLFEASKKLYSKCNLKLLTRTNRGALEKAAQKSNCDLSSVFIGSVGPDEVGEHLRQADVGVVMNQFNFDKIACSPTKLAECLATGLPVFANCKGIGDMEDIITTNRVGVVVEEQNQESWLRAVQEMKHLLTDPEVRIRCRKLAVDRFSVDVAVGVYADIYQRLVSDL
ncbi:MAG: glycosyltransferase [Planctomycetota bacterium]